MAEQQEPPAEDNEVEQPVYYQRSTIASKAGWIVAGFFALVVLVILGYFLVFPSSSDRTPATANPDMIKLGSPAVSADVVLGGGATVPGDAAADYRSAVEAFENNLALIGKHIGEGDDDVDDDDGKSRWNITPEAMVVLKEIASHVRAGAKKANMKYSFVYSPKTFDVTYFYRPADELHKLTSALDTLATSYARQKKYAEAEAVWKAEFALGCHMMNERIRVDMGIRGLNIQDMALGALAWLYAEWGGEHAKRVASVKKYKASLVRLDRLWDDKRKIVWSPKPKPGDIFYLIESDEDRAWRVQALLALGVIKFTAMGDRGDKRKLEQLVAKYAAGDDPYLAAAAKAARDFTKEGFNQIGTKMY